MDTLDVEELAIAVLGMPEESDSDDIENAIYEKFDVSIETFGKIAESLLPLTIPGKSAITNGIFHGYVKDGCFICKIKAEQQ